jgi:aminopeptidase N
MLSMRSDLDLIVKRSDYRPPAWRVTHVELEFDLVPDATLVVAHLALERDSAADPRSPLELDGEALELVSIAVDGRALSATEYSIEDSRLRVSGLPKQARLTTVSRTDPSKNSSLSGLYLSNGNFFTQCEAEGFRRITWFPDRPDVMARYRVTVRAARDRHPVLLSNGNLVAEGLCDPGADAFGIDRSGWHWATWEDPFPKPSYLFALVAGRLVATESEFTTRSGRKALLQVWVEPGNEHKTDHALRSLERSIRWDEKRFGLELDLDRFMIVAVADFNMGAMENKGLNIFNTRYVFAHPRIATDQDFASVEAVVAHEYFHNWTGNRVTCRDWFQLTLKEGLTVFRDQEFSADMMAAQCDDPAQAASARAVKRIQDVRTLRTLQFPEDAGPMAHPIRPDAYQEINNFYTLTVYEKGAEVIRMLQTLAGREGFRRGMDLYFARHDGQAVTCDDFIAAIADANRLDLAQFGRWYEQAGTPHLRIATEYDPGQGTVTLDISQYTPPTPGQSEKRPLHIPVELGLVGLDGRERPLVAADDATRSLLKSACSDQAHVVHVRNASHRLVFSGIDAPVVPSIARRFSAPVIVEYDYDDEALAVLARHDSDPFNRWEAVQQLGMACVRRVMSGQEVESVCGGLVQVFEAVLDDPRLDAAYRELMLSLPGEALIAESVEPLDPGALRDARQAVRCSIGRQLVGRWQDLYCRLDEGRAWSGDFSSAGRRALKNAALAWWIESGDRSAVAAAATQYDRCDNMTDRAAALQALIRAGGPDRDARLSSFEREFADEALAMDKWFTWQATALRLPGEGPVLERVRALARHCAFSMRNPNKVRALISAFCTGNLAEFHRADGSGYEFWADSVIQLDAANPQLAARLSRALDRWRKYEPSLQAGMQAALKTVQSNPGLSRDVAEIVGKALRDECRT